MKIRGMLVLAVVTAIGLGGCASHPLGIDDKAWQTMSMEDKLKAIDKQAAIDVKMEEERRRRAEELRKQEEAQNVLMIAQYQAQWHAPIMLSVSGTAISDYDKGRPYGVTMTPMTLAPCQSKEAVLYLKRDNRTVTMRMSVAYIPPVVYWDYTDHEKQSLYITCNAERLMDHNAKIIRRGIHIFWPDLVYNEYAYEWRLNFDF